MSARIWEFRYVGFAQDVIFAPGAVADLNAALDRLPVERLILCASPSAKSAGHVALLEGLLAARLVAVYDLVQPHVQDFQVAEALELAVESDVDAVIGMGGGSPIGMAKAVAFALEERRTRRSAHAASPTEQPLIPVIAIPTTYAGSEMTAVYGITHTNETPARKVTFSDPKVAPRLVIYDPKLTLDLPPALTASTGVNALAHCIEALYSIRRNPLSTAAAIQGIRHIFNALLRSHQDGGNLEARTELLLGAHLAGLSLASVSMGLHHGLCHVLGGSANVPHGIANSIVLPHAIRFNAEATAIQLLPAAQAIGLPINGTGPAAVIEAMAEMISGLIAQMGLPQRLRDASVRESDLPRLAELAFGNHTVQNNPRPISDAAEIERLLRDAW